MTRFEPRTSDVTQANKPTDCGKCWQFSFKSESSTTIWSLGNLVQQNWVVTCFSTERLKTLPEEIDLFVHLEIFYFLEIFEFMLSTYTVYFFAFWQIFISLVAK